MSKGFWGALAVVAAIVLTGMAFWPSPSDAAEDAWNRSVMAELHSHQAFVLRETQAHQRVVHLQTVAAWWQDSVLELKNAYTALQGQADSFFSKGDTARGIVALKSSGAICGDAIAACQHRGDSLAAAVDTAEKYRLLAVARADHADSLNKAGASLKSCRILLVSCPTRTQSFGIGAGVATLVFVLLKKF